MAANEDIVDSKLEPDPAQYDPMAEVCWTLPMAVAWIRWGTADAVREQWDDWREQCFERQTHEDGYYSVPRRKASLAALLSDNNGAWLALKQALVNGELTATGIRTGSDSAAPIPSAEWERLEDHPTGPHLTEKFRYVYTSKAPDHGYDEILLKRTDVQQIASAAAESTIPRREKKRRGRPSKHTPECEAAARQIVANMKASPAQFGKTDEAAIKAFRTWYGGKYPNEPKPVRSTVQDWFTRWGL